MSATMIQTTGSGRLAMTCGCGVTEKVRPRFAAQRKVFCNNCYSVLRYPQGQEPSPTARADRPSRRSPTTSGWNRNERRPSDQRLPRFERHVLAIGGWNLVGGVLTIVGAVVAAVLNPLALVVGLPVGAAFFALGYGLNRYSNVCRWLTVALSALGILLAVGGLLSSGQGVLGVALNVTWNLAIIGVLASSTANRVFTPSFRNVVARSRSVRVPWWTSPFFWIPAALIVISLSLAALAFAGLLLAM